MPIDLPNTYIVLVFFTSGISLKTTELRNAVTFPKALLLGLTLILFITPLLGLAYMQLSGSLPYQEFVIGLATFAVMPTTVAASVVIVGLAKGNTGLALVLSVATNIIGVVTVPFILKFVIGAGDDMKPFKLLLQLFCTILVPVLCGKLASFWPPVLAFAQRFATEIKLFTSFFLAVIPYVSVLVASSQSCS